MSMEPALVALLQEICPRTFPDVAPEGVERPYVTWQALGGESIYTLGNAPIDKRHTLMQINVWAPTRQQAITMAREIEAAMAASANFVAKPAGEPISTHEPETSLYGSIQRFTIWHNR